MTDFEKADEMLHLAEISDDVYEAAVGGYLRLYLAAHPDEAGKFLDEGGERSAECGDAPPESADALSTPLKGEQTADDGTGKKKGKKKNKDAAEQPQPKKKDVKGCMKHIKEAAREKAKDGVAVLSDAEVFRLAREYFGLADDDETKGGITPPETAGAAPLKGNQSVPLHGGQDGAAVQSGLDFDFDDFLA